MQRTGFAENLASLKKAAIATLAGLGLGGQVLADAGDSHYSPAGFFDAHICNWPDQPPFLMALFSSENFNDIAEVAVLTPSGELLGKLDLAKYRAFKSKTNRDKRAFIEHFELPAKPLDGWYKGVVTLKDGRRFETMDYVVHTLMPFPQGRQPANDAEGIDPPSELRWNPVPGAAYYQVFVYDRWLDQLILSTELGPATSVKLPPGLLQRGGLYGWRVHARDVNGHILLGDFNHGITSPEYRFTTR